MITRRAGLSLTVSVLVCLLAACTPAPDSGVRSTGPADPGAQLREMTRQLDASGPYRDPTRREAEAARQIARDLLTSPQATEAVMAGLDGLGFRTVSGLDPITGRPYLLAVADPTTERSWGAVLADTSALPSLAVEVPHPGFDVSTDVLGIELFRARPGAVLIVAGAHRLAGDGSADVAHNAHSFFHVVATELARGGVAELQLHGFANKSLKDVDIAVSTGSGRTTPQAQHVAAQVAKSFRTCVAWLEDCGQLEGNTNVQGRHAAAAGTVFVHMEISWTVRGDRGRRALLVDSVVTAI